MTSKSERKEKTKTMNNNKNTSTIGGKTQTNTIEQKSQCYQKMKKREMQQCRSRYIDYFVPLS